jgi:iron(III) transport system substrate-binding protein
MNAQTPLAIATLFLGVLFAACAPAATAPASPQGQAPASAPSQSLTVEQIANLPHGPERARLLEEGARREGRVMLYTSSTGLEPVAEAFMQRYPFIKMEIFSTRGEPLVQRTQAEAKAGRLNGDVVKSNLFVHDDLKDLMIRFNSSDARYDRVPNAASLDLTGIAFTYSKQRVAPGEVPQRAEDLLLPRWSRNLGLFSPPNNYAGRWVGSLVEHLGEQRTREYLSRLGEQRPYFYTQPEAARNGLLAGEWDVNMQGLTSAVIAARRGEPIGWLALDPTTLSPDIIGLFHGSPHPHAAMLLLDWAVSPEGQHIFTHGQGSITQEELDKREKEGVKLPARLTFQTPADVAKVDDWMRMFDELVVRK